MCSKNPNKKYSIPVSKANFAKFSIVLLFFFFAECAAGSCLSYGPACWGAHGKRSGSHNHNPVTFTLPKDSGSENTRWFISKLVPNQLASHMLRGIPSSPERQLLSDSDMENDHLKASNDWEVELSQEDNVPAFDEITNNFQRNRYTRKAPNLLKKRSVRKSSTKI